MRIRFYNFFYKKDFFLDSLPNHITNVEVKSSDVIDNDSSRKFLSLCYPFNIEFYAM